MQQRCRPEKSFRVPPERRAGGGAAPTQYTFIEPIKTRALFRRLQALDLRLGVVVNQPRLHRAILIIKLGEIDNQIADHRQAGQRPQRDRLFQLRERQDAGEPVAAVDVHAIRPAHALAAGAAEAQGIVLAFEQQECVQQHDCTAVIRQLIILHARPAVGLRVVTVDGEFHAVPSNARTVRTLMGIVTPQYLRQSNDARRCAGSHART